MDILQM
ncbi:hypothetical protein RDI58_029192 [Solanum bulbocastanum]